MGRHRSTSTRGRARWQSLHLPGAFVVAFALPSLVGGCSLLFVDGPGTPAPGSFESASCTRSYLYPSIDVVIAGAELAQGLYVLSLPESRFQGAPVTRGQALGLAAAWMIVYGASAATGVSRVHACRESADARSWRPAPLYQPPRQTEAERAAEAAAVQRELREREAAAAKASAPAGERTRASPKSDAPGAPNSPVPGN